MSDPTEACHCGTYPACACGEVHALRAEVERLREALEKIAKQHMPAEMDQSDADMADWDDGFEAVVRIARAALQGEG